jgi:O-antigen ligase
MPLAMWLANRSSPLLLGLAASCFLAASVLAGRAGETMANLRRIAATPPGMAVIAFLSWSMISVLWSHAPGASLRDWGELVLPIACALVIGASGRFEPSPNWVRALALAIALACLLCVIELASGLSQRAALGSGKLMTFVFNRPAITALVLAVPIVHRLWNASRTRHLDRGLAIVLVLSVAALALRSESASARLGLAVCVSCWLAASVWPRVSARAVGFAFLAAMLLAPVLGLLAQNYTPAALLKRIPPMTGQARIDIWQSFGEAARARPVIGAGFGTSPSLDRHPVAALVSPERRPLLAVGHPHDMPLQAWVETGAIGALLLTVAGWLLLASLRRLPPCEAAPRLALFAACFAISVVGHGAWQGWWIAVLGAAILWFPARDERQGEHHG